MNRQDEAVEATARPLTRRIVFAVGELFVAAIAGAIFAAIRDYVPDDFAAVQVIAWFAFVNAIGFIAVAVITLQTSHYPLLGHKALHDGDATGVSAWPIELWHSHFIDMTLAAAGIALPLLDLLSGGQWLPWSLVLALGACWLVARLFWYLSGRKHAEALWVTQTQVIHQASWGVERAQLADLCSILGSGNALVIRANRVERDLCPRLWRGTAPSDNVIAVDTALFGHRSEDLACWLEKRTPQH